MAMAARRERGLFDPDAAPGESLFDHHIYVIAGDGCMEEGVTSEASSLAGHQQLGNLIVFYDDNHISIEDNTAVAFSEDVVARYEAYGWHTQRVDSGEDVVALEAAIKAAQAETAPPVVHRRAHDHRLAGADQAEHRRGARLGAGRGRDPQDQGDPRLRPRPALLRRRRTSWPTPARSSTAAAAAHAEWQTGFDAWAAANPDRAALLDRMSERAAARRLDRRAADASRPRRTARRTRSRPASASGKVLTALADPLPELWGGSADLAESNLTTMEGEPSFVPAEHQTKMWPGGPYGRTLHFGIREHAMGSIMNGIVLHGGTRVYGGTFLVFSDYMRPPVRLAALMKLPTIYVWTHDSIGLGGDGPTHQPIEHLAALRAIPGLDVVRPADANETAVCWRMALEHTDRPTALALSRQNLPVLDPGRGRGRAPRAATCWPTRPTASRR